MKLILSLLSAAIVAMDLIPSVAERRGYFAIGGEWILLIVITVGMYYFLGWAQKRHVH